MKNYILIAAFLLLFSCQKEEFQTDGQRMADNLASVADKYNITTARIFENGALRFPEALFYVEGSIVRVQPAALETHYYNCSTLTKFEMGSNNSLRIYFSID